MITITVYRILHDGTRVGVLPPTTFTPRDPERLAPPLSFPPCRCLRCRTAPGTSAPSGAAGPPGPAVIDADG